MKPWQASLGAELQHEVEVVRRLAPGLPIALPTGKPNTRPAIETAIGILRHDSDRGMEFVRKVYRAFWIDGRDISDVAILADLSGNAGDAGRDDAHIAQEWEEAWHATGRASVPLIVLPDGDLLVGCMPKESIGQFFS
jgi:predicted DsbA family dithiol-disulfide isomerase